MYSQIVTKKEIIVNSEAPDFLKKMGKIFELIFEG
jgi:hypothetical protein